MDPAHPTAERPDLAVEELHGHGVADPGRRPEDAGDPCTRTWPAARDAPARAHLDALPGRAAPAAGRTAPPHPATGVPATRPVLLRRETDGGHGARSVSRSVARGVDRLAFPAAHTGLELPAP